MLSLGVRMDFYRGFFYGYDPPEFWKLIRRSEVARARRRESHGVGRCACWSARVSFPSSMEHRRPEDSPSVSVPFSFSAPLSVVLLQVIGWTRIATSSREIYFSDLLLQAYGNQHVQKTGDILRRHTQHSTARIVPMDTEIGGPLGQCVCSSGPYFMPAIVPVKRPFITRGREEPRAPLHREKLRTPVMSCCALTVRKSNHYVNYFVPQ
ncbi:hypothetical protein GY45DRAFT_669341 [Cubamyces sp. BRFM 1775]|nr:hypothetical protein GY45DRAFT_669341 [Cubamyces sp. BRFM 1775]